MALRRRGFSVRQIVAVAGISRSSVARICRQSADDVVLPGRRLGRCPTCGAMVRLPCLACSLRSAPPAARQAWQEEFSQLENAMDLVKEITELKQAIQDALEDRRLTFLEIVRIAKEAADVLRILAPIILGSIDARLNEQERPRS